MTIRMFGCRACEQITSGDCGMHGPLFVATTLTVSGSGYPIPQAAPSGAPDWLAASPPETAPADAFIAEMSELQHYIEYEHGPGVEALPYDVAVADDKAYLLKADVLAAIRTVAAHGSRPAGRPEKQVGCERPDGTLNIHSASVTCDICAGTPETET